MPDIKNFTLLSAGYPCILIKSHMFCHGTQQNYLENRHFFQVLFLYFGRPSQGSLSSGVVLCDYWTWFLGALLGTLWFTRLLLSLLWGSQLFLACVRPLGLLCHSGLGKLSPIMSSWSPSRDLSETYCRFKALRSTTNKHPETDIGVQSEGQQSKTAPHWLLPLPQCFLCSSHVLGSAHESLTGLGLFPAQVAAPTHQDRLGSRQFWFPVYGTTQKVPLGALLGKF